MTKFTEIFEGLPVRAARGYLGWSSCFLIQTDSGSSFLFDCAGPGDRGELKARLEQNGLSPEDLSGVILSHFHYDHAANWDLFPNAKFYLHERELEYVESGDATPDMGLLRHNLKAFKANTDLAIVQGERQQIGDLTFLLVPGHTPGSIAVQFDNAIFCSDALKHRWDIDRSDVSLPVWDPPRARRSIKKLVASADTLYPGHDSPLKKENGVWVPTRTPSETLSFANGKQQEIVL